MWYIDSFHCVLKTLLMSVIICLKCAYLNIHIIMWHNIEFVSTIDLLKSWMSLSLMLSHFLYRISTLVHYALYLPYYTCCYCLFISLCQKQTQCIRKNPFNSSTLWCTLNCAIDVRVSELLEFSERLVLKLGKLLGLFKYFKVLWPVLPIW